MCQFFSFVTNPVDNPGWYYYFDWEYRKANLDDEGVDNHSHICAHFKLYEDVCNKYEFNPLTKAFTIDQINSERDDSEAAEKWANRLDFKTIVEPLIIKPIVNPFTLPMVSNPTDEQIGWLKDWSSVGYSVGSSVRSSVGYAVGSSVRSSVGYAVGYSVGDSVRSSVGCLVGYSVWDAVGSSVRDAVGSSVGFSVWYSVGYPVGYSVGFSVRSSVWAYAASFFAIDFNHDFSSAVKLWEAGLVPSFDGRTWRLHTGKNADVVYEWIPEVQE